MDFGVVSKRLEFGVVNVICTSVEGDFRDEVPITLTYLLKVSVLKDTFGVFLAPSAHPISRIGKEAGISCLGVKVKLM